MSGRTTGDGGPIIRSSPTRKSPIVFTNRRPCHFNKWSFSLERWIPCVNEEFPNTLMFWALISGIPIHYKKDETYRNIGRKLGRVDLVDVENGRVRVEINGDKPLKFENRVQFDNGDMVKISIVYEDLYRYCFTCKRVSHEEGTCPDLTEEQKERNRITRLDQQKKEDLASKEAFSIPQTRRDMLPKVVNGSNTSEKRLVHKTETRSERRPETPREDDLRKALLEKRTSRSKEVWTRISDKSISHQSHSSGKYHPYRRDAYHRTDLRSRKDDKGSEPWRSAMEKHDSYRQQSSFRDDNDQRKIRNSESALSSSSARSLMSSQRTISDRRQISRYERRARNSPTRSPPRHRRLEWRPVQKETDQGGMNFEKNDAMEAESEAERKRRLKGKAIVVETQKASKEQMMVHAAIRAAENPSNIVIRESLDGQILHAMKKPIESGPAEPSRVENPHNGPLNRTAAVSDSLAQPRAQDVDSLGLTDKDEGAKEAEVEGETEEDLERLIAQYADVEMDEDQMENDDLLIDEMNDFPAADEPQIDAISQLTPEKKKSSGQEMVTLDETRLVIEQKERSGKDKSISTRSKKRPSDARQRVPRSPNMKRVTPSKKVLLRGRSSPLSKIPIQKRGLLKRKANTTQVPRSEAFPSARCRNLSSKFGSVGSQKPPNPQI